MKKKISALVGITLAAAMTVSGCANSSQTAETSSAETSAAEAGTETSQEGTYTPGTYTASAKGYGGDVTVTVTVDEFVMTEVVIEGKRETEGIGKKAIEELPAAILEAQSENVDAVSGATVTSKAVSLALSQALAQAKGQEETAIAVKMEPGSYTASAQGFAKAEQLEVTVTVSEDKIEKIEVNPDNGETATVLQSAIDLMIPRMIEHQSVSVDAICGATVSSNAIKTATEAALVQAITAVGGSEADVKAFYVEEPVSTAKEELDVDVLVVGMGGSGFTAAMSAAEAQYEAAGKDASKVSVLGIDKAGKYGGTSALM